MTGRGLVGCALAFAIGLLPPSARGADEAERVAAARVQIDLWLDLGELGQALALSRRGVRKLPDDPAWHEARLRALDAAGLGPWILAEYAEVARPSPAQAEAWRRFRAAREAEPTVPDLGALTEAALALPADDATESALAPFAPLFGDDGSGRPSKALVAARAAVLAQVDRRIEAADGPLGLLRAAELLSAIDDGARLSAVAARLVADGGRPPTTQDRLDGFSAGPAGWRVWDVPLRGRRTPAALDSTGRDAARSGTETLPWGRPEELRRMAEAAARAYLDDGRPASADRIVTRYLGGCAPSRRGEALVRGGEGAEGRALAVEHLLHCVGGTDLFPFEDVAGLELGRAFVQHADAWHGFARVADLGRTVRDAAVAYGIAARLEPTAERVALARKRAAEAGLDVDGTGLPTVGTLVRALDELPWLTPAQALQASRARVAKARTGALLAPTPERLLARITPDDLCLPTIRERCMLERAVAAEAFRRAGLPVPGAVAEVSDAGAVRAAPGWLDRLDRAWFQRTVALRRLVVGDSGEAAVARILAGDTGVRVGGSAPRWRLGGLDSTDLRGDVVVLAVWASWSRPSFALLPLLDGLAARWSADGIDARVVAVAVDPDESAFRRAFARLPVEGLMVGRSPELRARFEVEELPTTFVVDGTGVLREVVVGYEGGEGGTGAVLDAAVRTWAAVGARSSNGR